MIQLLISKTGGGGVREGDLGAGVGVGDMASLNDEQRTVASDASAQEVSSLKMELKRRETRSRMHEKEVEALRAELDAAKAIAVAQMEEQRARLAAEQQQALAAMRAELEEALQSSRAAQSASASVNPGLANMMQLVPPGGGGAMIPTLQLPSEEAAGTAGVAMASAQMLMVQATAAAQVIASLAATVRELEAPHKELDPASPSH